MVTLATLKNFEIVVRRYQIMEKRSKRRRYFLFDLFYTFWFRCVHPNIDLIELGDIGSLKRMGLDELEHYVSKFFEDIARDTLLATSGRFGKDYDIPVMTKIGA